MTNITKIMNNISTYSKYIKVFYYFFEVLGFSEAVVKLVKYYKLPDRFAVYKALYFQ